jgi:hypothetical protein
MGQTLHGILAEVLLYTLVAMGLAVSCLPRATCCRRYHVFVSTAAMIFCGAKADTVVAAAMGALALRICALADEGPLLLTAALLGLLFPTQSAAA